MKILTSMSTVHTKQVSIAQNPRWNTKLNTQNAALISIYKNLD
jgi:hypothetical protein